MSPGSQVTIEGMKNSSVIVTNSIATNHDAPRNTVGSGVLRPKV